MDNEKRHYGYVKRMVGGAITAGSGYALVSSSGEPISQVGHRVSCVRIPPGRSGSWISGEKCSYRFKIDGEWYAGLGYGEGMSIGVRKMKRPPRGFSGLTDADESYAWPLLAIMGLATVVGVAAVAGKKQEKLP